jgi:HNH endonuclease
MQTVQDRFIRKVIYNPQSTCWEWIGAKYRNGYGHFRRKVQGVWKMVKAHRYSYEFYNKTDPLNYCVLHKCDNPSCVNPDHLFLGTHKDNTLDMKSKNRWKLIRNPRHNLLSLEIARNIRKFSDENPDMSGRDLAKLFKTSPTQISRILSNKIWQEEN